MKRTKIKKIKKNLIDHKEMIAMDILRYSKKGNHTKSGEPVRIEWLKKTNVRIGNLISTLIVLEEYYEKEKLYS